MSTTTQTCITVTCDDCGRSSLSDNEDYDYTPHFHTVDEARETLTDNAWTWPHDGPTRCRDCSERAVCAADGHTLSSWTGCLCDGKLPRHPEGCGRTAPSAEEWRYCQRCSGAHESRAAS